ncbi:ankyrin-1-like [Panicum miliaceum]|uniref:Ankyrin-1-like n=1 Tax=Panicum miliaceum TaxID=4540 RepID=A0A3L6TKI8_PANMI|nr:ankyrin-1-like [Panicum miliaceum]
MSDSKVVQDDDFVGTRKSELKKQGDDAFRRQDYRNASAFYTQAMKVDRYDAELFSDRSLCWLRTGDGRRALRDAVRCKILRPKWAKAYVRKGQALILMKDYEKACDEIAEGLELNPLSDELDKLYWEAMELKNGGTEAA